MKTTSKAKIRGNESAPMIRRCEKKYSSPLARAPAKKLNQPRRQHAPKTIIPIAVPFAVSPIRNLKSEI
jgi:hypothetical protein